MDRLSPEQETLMTWLELRPSPVCLREMQEKNAPGYLRKSQIYEQRRPSLLEVWELSGRPGCCLFCQRQGTCDALRASRQPP